MPQIQFGRVLVASIIAAFVGITGLVMAPLVTDVGTQMYLEPRNGLLTVGENFVVKLKVEANIPVNVFGGLIKFDNRILAVERIDYNTSIADLWAVEPWYSNGDGTLEFAGGTTKTGGFTGSDTLITIIFKTIGEGDGALQLTEARIIQHDGLGTDIELIDHPIDALFSVAPEVMEAMTVVKAEDIIGAVRVVAELPSTDLNGDGKQTITDISIFMVHFANQNAKADFNGDQKVSLADLSVLLEKK